MFSTLHRHLFLDSFLLVLVHFYIYYIPKKIIHKKNLIFYFSFVKIRGGNQYGEVPINYVCHRCHNPGHWIKNCPNNNTTAVRSIIMINIIILRSNIFFF